MNFGELFKKLVVFAGELAELDEAPEQKLAELTAKAEALIEAADDTLVGLLPPGLRDIAKLVVDNPVVDAPEREIAKALAEAAYQAWKVIRDFSR